MAEPTKPNNENTAKMEKLQTDLDKMKRVAKKLLQQKQKGDEKIKQFKQENNTLKENVNDLQSKLSQSQQLQSQLEDAMEKKNGLISSLEQKINHKDEAAALQHETSQQILQELNNKCAQYETQINEIQTEKAAIQETNAKLLTQIEQFEANNASLKESMQESLSNRQEMYEKDSERAKTLKSQMKKMTEMMSKIQSENANKISELEDKLTVSLERTEEISNDNEKQVHQYEKATQLLTSERDTINVKYDRLKEVLSEEKQRSKSLMELNAALKNNVMNLHAENDELEDSIDEIKQKYIELTEQPTVATQTVAVDDMNNTNNSTQNTMEQNAKIRDLRSKTIGFKQSIEGLKNDMNAIAMGFREQLVSSTAGLAEIHKNQVQEKNKYIDEIKRLNDIKHEYEEYRITSEQTIGELNKKMQHTDEHVQEIEKQLKNEREERQSIQTLYDTLVRDCKDMQQHLHDVQSEYDQYKSQQNEVRDTLANEFNEKHQEKEKLHDINLAKAVQQNQELKQEIEKINNDMQQKHDSELESINNEKIALLKKYNDVDKINQQMERELNMRKNEIEELLCNNQNMQDQIVKIKQDSNENNSIDKEGSIVLKRSQTPHMKPKSADFSNEIHKQLKDDNTAKQTQIEALEHEMAAVNEKYQTAAVGLQAQMQKYDEIKQQNDELQSKYENMNEVCDKLKSDVDKITQAKKSVSTKLVKYSQNLKTAMQRLKQYKADKIKMEQMKKDLQNKCDELTDNNTKLKQVMEKNSNELQTQNEVNDKYNTLDVKYNELIATNKTLTDDIQQLKNENDKIVKQLQQDMENKNVKFTELSADYTSMTQKNQILQMEYEQMKKQTQEFKQRITEVQNDIKTAEQRHTQQIDKIKSKYKAYITKQNKNINANTHKLEALTKEYESKAIMANEYETESTQKYEALKTELTQKYDTLQSEYDTVNTQKNEIQKRYQTLSNEYEVMKSDVEQIKTDKTEADNKLIEMEKTHKESFAKYKEKAKSVVNKHKSNAEKQIQEIKNTLDTITTEKNNMNQQYQQLLLQNENINNEFNTTQQHNQTLQQKLTALTTDLSQQKQTKNAFEQSIADLNAKLRANQSDMTKLSKQTITLKETNDELENKLKSEKMLKDEMDALKSMCDKREDTLNKISAALSECSFFKANESMSIMEGVNTLAQNYEDISIKHSESKSTASDHELKLKEQKDKIKRLAVNVRKLQNLRSKLQKSLESTKAKLNESIKRSEQYHKSLQTIHCEIQRSLDKWKVFMNNINNNNENNNQNMNSNENIKEIKETNINETDQEYLKRCLSDVRSLSMYFIQSLDMFREKNEQHHDDTSEMESNLKSAQEQIETYKKELEDSRKHIESTDHSQIAKNTHIEKLTEKLNHAIGCIRDNWHHDITKADFVDLAMSTRLVLEDKIWCLIRWRHKLPDIPQPQPQPINNENETKEKTTDTDTNTTPKKKKYNDEFFWTAQTTYLKKLNVAANEIYLPDFYENKLENQITKTLESKWKAIQRRTDRQIQELKSQKEEEQKYKSKAEEQFKQYKAKAKVILQKQKDELTSAGESIKQLESYRSQVVKLKEELSLLSTENWAEKYREIENSLAQQKTDLQNKKLELTEIQSKLLLKERELTLLKQEFEKEKDEIQKEFESEKINSKKKYAKKLDDYRMRAREMLQEKDKQLSIARARLKNANTSSVSSSPITTTTTTTEWNVLKYDKETQTEIAYPMPYEYETYDNYDENEQKYQQVTVEIKQKQNQNQEQIITSTDDLIAALQPPLNATIPNKEINKNINTEKDDHDILSMSTSNITAMARMQASRDQKVRELEERLRRLQQLLNTSEEEHKKKDSELLYLQTKNEQIEQAKDVKKSADNSEYLKNALLQYFDGKINVNQLVSVVAVGLRFNDDEQKKAQNSKLIVNAAGIGGYVKSWWA